MEDDKICEMGHLKMSKFYWLINSNKNLVHFFKNELYYTTYTINIPIFLEFNFKFYFTKKIFHQKLNSKLITTHFASVYVMHMS
jgi:hypothetical protein